MTHAIGKRQRITAEILRHVDAIAGGAEINVAGMSPELRDFLRPLSLRQVKAVVLAAAKSDAVFWEKLGGALELLLTEQAGRNPGGDEHGLGQLVGQALHKARLELDQRLARGLTLLRGGKDAA